MHQKDPIILGIETSCDETSMALYSQSHGVIGMQTFSQIALHEKFGGVVPEIAARSQLEKVHHVFEQLFSGAQFSIAAIDAVAVTTKPGLPGSLMVGASFAKGVAIAAKRPLIAVDHLEGHAFSPLIEHGVPFPHLCLTASGGHTSLHYIRDFGATTILSYTLDDAAGEAFDKVAKLMNLPYPGGPVIEKLAAEVGYEDFFGFPRLKLDSLHFSFSGLKTAVLYELVRQGAYDMQQKKFLAVNDSMLQRRIASSLLCAVADIFVKRIEKAVALHPEIRAITFAGGVACNRFITQKIAQWTTQKGIQFFKPSPFYCTDNGAMIAFVGQYRYRRNEFSPLTVDIL